MAPKRAAGQLHPSGKWLAITESVKEAREWLHGCETYLVLVTLHLSVEGSEKTQEELVPYCPHCETLPTGGRIDSQGKITIYSEEGAGKVPVSSS
jgi:hypothetical protein